MSINKLRCAYRLASALLIAGLPSAVIAANSNYLDLAQEPLFSGTSAKPNILVAVDDSGSMDWELLFPTDDGLLDWGGHEYSYIYPFDQIYGNRSTIPPIPDVAYARNPDYNKAYFNPTPNANGGPIYPPWLKADGSRETRRDEPATDARYNPTSNAGNIDLTEDQTGSFHFVPGMVIPGSDGSGSLPPGVSDVSGYVCYNSTTKEIQTPRSFFGFPYCRSSGYQVISVATLPGGSDETVTGSDNRTISYFPATFYLKDPDDREDGDAHLPDNYGYKSDKTIEGTAPDPDDKPLIGYEIKPDNFTSTAAYNTAIRDFANWFTYYRKRSLATRGGIVAAFDRISDVRVGSCTINKRTTLTMNDLDETDQRSNFYSRIFGIDYSKTQGTPNRKALKHLGDQLETNKSIITAPCQRNFAILFTDGYSNSDTVNIKSDKHPDGNIDGSYGKPFADLYGNTIADIAMRYYKLFDTSELDIKKGILRAPEACKEPNPPKRLDCETDLHMTTFGVTLNQSGTIFNNYDTEEHKKQNDDPYSNHPDWPAVNSHPNSSEQIDDLWHAAINTRGELLNADTPAEIADRFTTALERILAEEGSASGVELDSSSLAAESMAYQASFVSGAWFGDLKGIPQLADGSLGDSGWNASKILTDKTAPGERVILTTEKGNCGNGNNKRKPVAFDFDSFTSACKPEITKAEVNFIRGDRSMERANGGEFRNRNNNILGDIVHSTPLYVGKPNRLRYPADWNDLLQEGNEQPAEEVNPYYTSFAQGAALTRTPMVYVGANDGMLHGFEAGSDGGKERLAFLPGTLLEEVGALADPNYRHRYYVDGSPVSGDVIINGEWRTVLVGGLGAGGRAIYALDVTDPSAFTEDNADDIVLWEFRHPELGSTFGQPAIVRLHSGKWAAVFGNGYNSDSGSAQLFVVDIASGDLIKKLDTGAKPKQTTPCLLDITVGGISLGLGCGGNKNNRDKDKEDGEDGDNGIINGLSEVFPVDLDGDFITDYVYAGDLRGNLWRFDLTDASELNEEKDVLGGKKLFKATDASGNPQPITTQPQVATHPYGISYGTMVYFGTGKYIEEDDRQAKTKTLNSFYGIQDVDVFTFNNANGGEGMYETSVTNNIPRDRLQAQTINEVTAKNGDTYRLVSNEKFNYQTRDDGQDQDTKRGWYLDLNMPPGQGELVASNAQIQGDTVAFSTTIPNTEMCSASGSGYFMLLDRNSGGRTNFPAFDLNGDSQLNVNDTFARTVNGEDVAVGASGLLIEQGIPGQASHQLDPANDRAFFIVPASDGTTRQVYTNNKPDRRRSWREIRR